MSFTNIDWGNQISCGSAILTSSSSILINGKFAEQNRIELLAGRIREYLKSKEKVYISDLVEYFQESADIILKALKILKEKGLIEEVSN